MSRSLALYRRQLRRYGTEISSSFPALAHSSWFKLEDQGMKNFELLARGSGFLVHGPVSGTPIAMVSAHVAAPHRFPAYYPHEWLQHVRDSDCRSIFETRREDKVVRAIDHALNLGFRHAALDVAAFAVDDASLDRLGDVRVLTLAEEADVGDDVSLVGYRLIGESGSGSEDLMGVEMRGIVKEIDGARGFVDTGKVDSEMGMCGGPVVKGDTCVGLLEGLVPRPQEHEKPEGAHARLGGCSVYVGARELRMFVHDVETEATRAAQAR